MTSNSPLLIDGHHLTIEDVLAVARAGRSVALDMAARERLLASRAYVEALLTPDAPPVYGVNTGFGIFADRRVRPEDAGRLSRNLILSHAVGTGEPFLEEVVRAAMLIRANTLALGHSGVRPEIPERLLDMLNAGVTPLIPQQGSLGSSGDLAPLSHLALVLTRGEPDHDEESGQASYQQQLLSGREAMRRAGLERVVLGAKEGLALNNGATFCAALSALVVAEAENLVRHAELALALALEALLGNPAALQPELHAARRQAGQQRMAREMRALTLGSTFLGAGGRVQDPYCLRCAPQVLGPVCDTLGLVRPWVENELNAATDNPLIFPALADPVKSFSGGNFHGEVLGLGMDYLGIALAEVGALAERQTDRLVNEKSSYGLPPMLVGQPEAAGLNSGLMMLHYTAAALVLENQTLAHPDSVHSLPTSAGQEDHNANALTAARHAWQIVQNVTHILAVELFALAQAIDLRARALPQARLAPASQAVHARLRQVVDFVTEDRLFRPEIERVKDLVRSGELVRIAGQAAGLSLE